MSSLKFGSWRDWAAMARLPNIPTVWSNVFTAWVIAGATFKLDPDTPLFLLCLVGGTMLYAGGAILSDVADSKQDEQARPERALPAGRVAKVAALVMSVGCLLGGTLAFYETATVPVFVRLLLGTIVAYAIFHKRFPWLGIPLMGLCRAGLVVNVMAVAWTYYDPIVPTPAPGAPLPYVCTVWAYVSLISFLARWENSLSLRKKIGWMLAALPLLDAGWLAATGLAAHAWVPWSCFLLVLLLRRLAPAT